MWFQTMDAADGWLKMVVSPAAMLKLCQLSNALLPAVTVSCEPLVCSGGRAAGTVRPVGLASAFKPAEAQNTGDQRTSAAARRRICDGSLCPSQSLTNGDNFDFHDSLKLRADAEINVQHSAGVCAEADQRKRHVSRASRWLPMLAVRLQPTPQKYSCGCCRPGTCSQQINLAVIHEDRAAQPERHVAVHSHADVDRAACAARSTRASRRRRRPRRRCSRARRPVPPMAYCSLLNSGPFAHWPSACSSTVQSL